VAREAANSLSNPDATNLRWRRPPVRVKAKREVEDGRNKARFVNLLGSPGEEHRLQLTSGGKPSLSKQRKRARGLHSREGHNNFWFRSRSGAKSVLQTPYNLCPYGSAATRSGDAALGMQSDLL
jgi:hypothetical protein